MTKPLRSPLLGYNHNIRHLGRVFHVQTEDSGPTNPRLFTHLFFEGTILASRKEQYDAPTPDDNVRALMKSQHKSVIRDLMHGAFDERIVAFFQLRGEVISAGAMPTATMPETPPPVAISAAAAAIRAAAASAVAASAATAAVPAQPVARVVVPTPSPSPSHSPPPSPAQAPEAPPPAAPAGRGRTGRRSVTLPVEAPRGNGVVTVRPPDVRRPPFVRSGAPLTARTSSADGVVVQRSVVVGSGPAPVVKAARIRPPVPYVVGSGGQSVHTTPRPAPAAAVTPSATISGTPAAASALAVAAAAPAATAPISAVEAPRSTATFGSGLPDDKSLDEVILEYLSDDDEESGGASR